MPIIWEDGFESNSLAGYTTVTGTPTIQTSIVYEGARALRCNPVASQMRLWDSFSGTQTIACSFRIRRAHATEDTPYLFFLINAGDTGGLFVRYDGDGVGLRLYWTSPQTIIATSTEAWTLDAWTHIEVRANTSANPWSVNWRVNGVEQTGGAPATAALTFSQTDFGIFNYNMTHDTYFDKIQISNENAYIPQMEASVAWIGA